MTFFHHSTDEFLRNLDPATQARISNQIESWDRDTLDFYAVVDNWFSNFSDIDKDLAVRIFLKIHYYSEQKFSQKMRNGWMKILRDQSNVNRGLGDVLIILPDGRADSADMISYHVGKDISIPKSQFWAIGDLENRLENSNFDPSRYTIVFLNDTHGTGNQFVREFSKKIGLTKFHRFYVLAATISHKAKRRFEHEFETKITVVPDTPPSTVEEQFNARDMKRIKRIGENIYPSHPIGYGNTGLLIAYYYQCPNNSIPLIWADGTNNSVRGKGAGWNPLFPYRPKTTLSPPSNLKANTPKSTIPVASKQIRKLTKKVTKWNFTNSECEDVYKKILEWRLLSSEFLERSGNWFNNFEKNEKTLALETFAKASYLNRSKTRRIFSQFRDKAVSDIEESGGDIDDILLVTTGSNLNSVYHYVFEVLSGWRLEIDQVCRIETLTPDKVIDKTLIFFYHTRASGAYFIKKYSNIFESIEPRKSFIMSFAMTSDAIQIFQENLPNVSYENLYETRVSENINSLLPDYITEISKIESEIGIDIVENGTQKNLLTAYYFQCPKISSPLLWAYCDGSGGRRKWVPLFPHIEIPVS